MPIADWNCPMTLVSPLGTLELNDPLSPDGYFLVDNTNCKSGPAIRATADNVPQGDGSILHEGFLGGYELQMAIQYWSAKEQAACSTSHPSSEEMNDTLMRHLRAILSGGGRLIYYPVGQLSRIADRLQLFGTTIDLTENPSLTGVTFTLESQLPYTFNFTQLTSTLTNGSPTANLPNVGSSEYQPVIKVYGPFTNFALTNLDNLDALGNAKQIVYDDSLPGALAVAGGDYIEISTFENTVYLNGNGASRKAGIDIQLSDFWSLVPGDNNILLTAAGSAPTTDFLWQSAWL